MAGSSARKPLMAGNWKMHNTHFEGLALVQKLAFSLTDNDFGAVEVAVLPPFTGLRSVQTLVDGDKLRILYGAQDISPHDKGAYTGDVSGLMLAKLGCSTCWPATRSGASTTARTTRWSTPRRGRAPVRPHADSVHRREPGRAPRR